MLNARQRRRLDIIAEVAELIGEYGPGRAAALLNVHRTTVLRWTSGDVEPPEAVRIALRAAVRGQVPGMERDKRWQGWSFGSDGRLYTPSGRAHAPGDIMAQQYERALIKALQSKVEELEKRLVRALDETNTAANDPLLKLKSQ